MLYVMYVLFRGFNLGTYCTALYIMLSFTGLQMQGNGPRTRDEGVMTLTRAIVRQCAPVCCALRAAASGQYTVVKMGPRPTRRARAGAGPGRAAPPRHYRHDQSDTVNAGDFLRVATPGITGTGMPVKF